MKMLVNLKPQCDSVRKKKYIYISLLEIPSRTQQSYRKGFAGAEAAEKGVEASRGRVLWREDAMSLSPK